MVSVRLRLSRSGAINHRTHNIRFIIAVFKMLDAQRLDRKHLLLAG